MTLRIHIVLFTILCLNLGCNNVEDNYPNPASVLEENSITINTRPFKIGSEEFLADFGSIVVTENRSISTSRLITIPFLRIHAKSKNPVEPVFGLTGGPGMSNMSWDWGFLRMFLTEHDVVLVGYRGADGSTILNCPEVTKAFKFKNGQSDEAILKNIGEAWEKAAKRLNSEGVDLDGYTIPETIEDIESVRKALDYKRINLASGSYGTRVAYFYGLKYPENVFRSAMIGVNPPGRFIWEPEKIDSQLKYYSALWSRDSILSKKSPDLYQTMRKVLENMPRRWLSISINEEKVRVVTFCLLFQRNSAAQVFDAYVAAEHGDASGLALMSLAYNYFIPSLLIWGDLACKAVSADFDSTRNYYADMSANSDKPLGSPLSKLLWAPLNYSRWPVIKIPGEYLKTRHTDTETLILSGSIDFSTPAEFSTNELLPCLNNGKQIIFFEYGHVGDVMYVNFEDTKRILTSFFNSEEVDSSLHTYNPVNFKVKLSFSKIAKLAVAIVVFIIAAFATLIIWLIKRNRKHKTLKKIRKSNT